MKLTQLRKFRCFRVTDNAAHPLENVKHLEEVNFWLTWLFVIFNLIFDFQKLRLVEKY